MACGVKEVKEEDDIDWFVHNLTRGVKLINRGCTYGSIENSAHFWILQSDYALRVGRGGRD